MYGSTTLMDDILDLRKKGGKWLKSLRERAGLSQRELADRLGMKFYTFISQLENGTGRIPPDRYENWAAALGISTSDFVRTILSYYDPITFRILFGEAESIVSEVALPMVRRSEVETELLREKIRELQRLLGKKTAEYEFLKEKWDQST
jgi:transcriptional regulator with XRE-family HTH domain